MLTQIVYHREMVHIDVYVEKVISVSYSNSINHVNKEHVGLVLIITALD